MSRIYIIDTNEQTVAGFVATVAKAKTVCKGSRTLAYVQTTEEMAGLSAETLTGVRNSVIGGRAAAVKTVQRRAPEVAEKVFAALADADLADLGAKKTTKKVASEKTSAKKDKGEAARGRPGRYDRDAKIVIATESKANPCREGSAVYDRFELYRKHKTVGSFLDAGGRRGDLRWHEARGEITIQE